MKGIGIFLAVVGVIALGVGVYAYIWLNNQGMSGSDFEAIVGFASAFGVTKTLDTSTTVQMELVRNRNLLIIGGAVATLAGLVMWRYGRAKPTK